MSRTTQFKVVVLKWDRLYGDLIRRQIWDVWPNAVVTGSYEGEVQYLKQWLRTRIDWMDAQFNP